MALEDRLDLHGLSKEQAHKQLISFISRAVQQNLRHVLVITGKGRDGQGVLRHRGAVVAERCTLWRDISMPYHRLSLKMVVLGLCISV